MVPEGMQHGRKAAVEVVLPLTKRVFFMRLWPFMVIFLNDSLIAYVWRKKTVTKAPTRPGAIP
jgi:hypothetical protein